MAQGELDLVEGLVGDDWSKIGSTMTDDGSPHPDMQVTLMNARVIALLAGSEERWSLAGDQLFVDLDLSTENLPPGDALAGGRRSPARGNRHAAHRLQAVRRALRHRCHEVRQLARG